MTIFKNLKIKKGKPFPLGTSYTKKGINFAFLSNGKKVFLKLKIKNKIINIVLNKAKNIFYVQINKLPNHFLYAYEVDKKIVNDPFASSFISPTIFNKKPDKDTYLFAKVKIATNKNKKDKFDWQKVKKPNLKMKDLIIYEMHVRSFTKDISSKVKYRGSFLGLIEKIDHLKKLGITAVELMPIFEFDETSYNKVDPITKQKLCNYWGYGPISFFSIMKRYGSENDLKTLIRELHKNKIEVILDVVYNHLQNPIKDTNYFLLDNKNDYLNFSGCGNTFNCNSKVGSKLILDSLIYFAKEFQIDGFRFDLTSILTRDENGKVVKNPPILQMIQKEKKLKNIKLIAEPWDASGLYQLGFFKKYKFLEWNDKFRDAARRFIRGDKNIKNDFAKAFLQKDLNINYITCHDGFTLLDLVSYEKKHNLNNAEKNKDGTDNNYSSNSEIEGKTQDRKIQKLRLRKVKNFLVSLILSKGFPMLFMGDEYLHTKNGNNNSWCQDNKLNYFLWNKKKVLFNFIKFLIKFRKENFSSLLLLKLDEKASKKFDKFLVFKAKDFVIIFNSNDQAISINLDKKYKIILSTYHIKQDLIKNKLTLKSYSTIILKKQD